jgi:YbgC/YbaW family acyl-CoA thioester hydrolase
MIYVHRTTFDEMDFARVTFFGRHFYWLEHATTAWLIQKGIGFAVLAGQYAIGLPIVAAECRYLAPIMLEQTVEIHLALRDLSRRGFTTPFEVVRQDDGVLAAYGSISRRVVDLKRFRGTELSDELYAKFEEMAAETRDLVFRHEAARQNG